MEPAKMQIMKMKQGMTYSRKEKIIILNVYKYFRTQMPEKSISEITRRTAKATGCSEKSVFQFRKEEASAEGIKEPNKTKIRTTININSREIKYDCEVRDSIRRIIYDLKQRNIVPSLSTIVKQVNANSQLPNFSVMTLRRLLSDMGFFYMKSGNKPVLVEDPNARVQTSRSMCTSTTKQVIANQEAPINAALPPGMQCQMTIAEPHLRPQNAQFLPHKDTMPPHSAYILPNEMAMPHHPHLPPLSSHHMDKSGPMPPWIHDNKLEIMKPTQY